MVLFVVVEKKVKHPLLPLRVATERNRAAAFLASFLAGAVLIGGILFINYYIQIVLGFAPFIAGLASLPMTVVLIVTAAHRGEEPAETGRKDPHGRRAGLHGGCHAVAHPGQRGGQLPRQHAARP